MTVLPGEKRGEGTCTRIFNIVDVTPLNVGVWGAYACISIYSSNILSDEEDGPS